MTHTINVSEYIDYLNEVYQQTRIVFWKGYHDSVKLDFSGVDKNYMEIVDLIASLSKEFGSEKISISNMNPFLINYYFKRPSITLF